MEPFKYQPELIQINWHQYLHYCRQLGYSDYDGIISKELIYNLPMPKVYFGDKIHVLIKNEDTCLLKNLQSQSMMNYFRYQTLMVTEIINPNISDMINHFQINIINNPQNDNLALFYPEDRQFIITNYQKFIDGNRNIIDYLSVSTDLGPFYNFIPCSLVDKKYFRIINLFSATTILSLKNIPFKVNLVERNLIINQSVFDKTQTDNFDSRFKLVKQKHLGKILSQEINICRQEMADSYDDSIDSDLATAYNDQIENILLKKD